MIQSSSMPALPSVGPLLGAAFDRAVTTVLRSWSVVVILVVIECLIVVASGPTRKLETLLLAAWGFFAMANAIRVVFDPSYRMTNQTAGSMFGAGLIIGLAIVLVNIVGFVALVTAGQNALVWLLAVPGAVVGISLYVRWSCGPALAARGLPATNALSESWRLTAVAFWPTFLIPCANLVANFMIGFVFGAASQLPMNLTSRAPGSVAAISNIEAVLVFVAQLYTAQAYVLAICMWLKALQATQPAESPAVS